MLELRELRLRRGAAVLFDRANLTIFRGDKIGIVGRNGCGKSSLLALLRGDLGADAGDYSVPGKLNFVSVSQELPRTESTVARFVTLLCAIRVALRPGVFRSATAWSSASNTLRRPPVAPGNGGDVPGHMPAR